MDPEQMELLLEAPGATHSSGGVVSGRVVLSFYRQQRVRAIFVELMGEAEVNWTETESRSNSKVAYSSRQSHADTRVTLLGGAGQELLLPPGQHVYPFQAQLPSAIPPSFEGDHGHVRYRVKAVMERLQASDLVSVAHIRVQGVLDLNQRPSLKEPAKQVEEKTLCCCCCRSGPLTLVTHVPHTGFVPGQGVSVSVEVDNATDTNVSRVVCRLVQKVAFHAMNPSKKSKRTEDHVAAVEFGSVEPRGSGTWTRTLRIPQDLPPTGLPHCSSLIQLSYCLVVKAEVSGPHIDPTVVIPVVVGTVPLAAAAEKQQQQAPPLPTYDESMHGFMPTSPLNKYQRLV